VVPTEKFKVGDLVVCKYDFDYYFITTFPYDAKDVYYIGIIIGKRSGATIFLDQSAHFEVLCVDGERRYFTTWEMTIL